MDLSEQRVKLTFILLDLLEQQSKRKQELFDTLICLEMQKEHEQQDFWLLQYQKLLDSQPCELSFKSSSIDPMLGYNFLINGVVHCIPFLSKLWQSDKCNIVDITDDDLNEAGIKNANDREKILKSINDFLQQEKSRNLVSLQDSKVILDEPTAPIEQIVTEITDEPNSDLSSECVVCMEETVIYLFQFLKMKVYSFCFSISVQSDILTMWPFMLLSKLSKYHRKLSNVSCNN